MITHKPTCAVILAVQAWKIDGGKLRLPRCDCGGAEDAAERRRLHEAAQAKIRRALRVLNQSMP